VHLARCYGVTSCVVFGPTPSDYFGYPGNINVDPAFCGGCWWIEETWMDRCPRRFPEARCLTEQDPGTVAARVRAWLAASMPEPDLALTPPLRAQR
jgi:ADP-heptose:LPS heptosyltransferase